MSCFRTGVLQVSLSLFCLSASLFVCSTFAMSSKQCVRPSAGVEWRRASYHYTLVVPFFFFPSAGHKEGFHTVRHHRRRPLIVSAPCLIPDQAAAWRAGCRGSGSIGE
ncbi:hypothetical protein GGR56DRAFT_476752 [Xylariaceae sp. FL0804]|nr:hypothetical protein GGR56DRAFT_476752 [Xylariaceae sp. FL0804]